MRGQQTLAPVIAELQAAGITSLRGIWATALNARGIPTASGRGDWQAVEVFYRALGQLKSPAGPVLSRQPLRASGWI